VADLQGGLGGHFPGPRGYKGPLTADFRQPVMHSCQGAAYFTGASPGPSTRPSGLLVLSLDDSFEQF